MHSSLDEFSFQPDLTTDFELAALECLKNCSFHLFCVAVGKIPFNLACN